jgi:hypothetical protein
MHTCEQGWYRQVGSLQFGGAHSEHLIRARCSGFIRRTRKFITPVIIVAGEASRIEQPMSDQKTTTLTGYLISSAVIAAAWFVLSFVLSLMLAEAEDNPDMTATTPWPLKVACAVAFFPMRYLQHWDHSRLVWVVLGMVVNALFWGLLLSCLYSLAARLFATK